MNTEKYTKEAIINHLVSFTIIALQAYLRNDEAALYEWFRMAYQCVREHKASEPEVEEAYEKFKEILRTYWNKPMTEFIHYLTSSKGE